MNERDRKRERDAHHEAGHCVAAWHFGMAHVIGFVELREHDRRVCYIEDLGDAEICVTLAGKVAECRLDWGSDDKEFVEAVAWWQKAIFKLREQLPGDTDVATLRCLLHVEANPVAAQGMLDQVAAECRKLITDHWEKVTALAAALYPTEALNGDRVCDLLGPPPSSR